MTSSAAGGIGGLPLAGSERFRRCWRRDVIDGSIAAVNDVQVRLIVSPVAAKGLAGLPGRNRRALFARVEVFAANPFAAHSGARPLRGHEDRVRVRHGDWRAICRIDRATETVLLERVEHRRKIYR